MPVPSRIALTRPAASGRGSRTSAAGNAAAWTLIPVTIIVRRPIVSASRPVNSWQPPHSIGYNPLTSPMAASPSPWEAKSSGNTAQVRPSLRLLASPAWLAPRSGRLRQLVSLNTAQKGFSAAGPADGTAPGWAACRAVSAATCPAVSLTITADRASPATA